MRAGPALDQACPESPGGASAPIQIVGAFTDMRSTGEHAYGYRVELWRQGRRPFGLFMASQGLAGDTPTGLLEAVEFDSGTGRMASHPSKPPAGSPLCCGAGRRNPWR